MFISAAGFARDGKLLFEDVEALLVMGSNQWYAANSHGIWSYTGGSLDLAHQGITFKPMNWNGPFIAAHTGFIAGDQFFKLDEKGNPARQRSLRHTFRVGDVSITEDMAQKSISGHIGTNRSAFSRRGFAWDQGRRGLGYKIVEKEDEEGKKTGETVLLMLSDAGIHPVIGYTGFEAPPPGAGPGEGRIYSPAPGELYFQSRGTWYKRTGPSKWRQVRDPRSNRDLIDDGDWKWELANGRLDVSLKISNQGFKVIRTNQGLGFNADLLRDAAAFNDQLAVISPAFTEVTDPAGRDQVSFYKASRYKPPGMNVDRLFSSRGSTDSEDLVLRSGQRYYSWNGSSHRFEGPYSAAEQAKRGMQLLLPQVQGKERLRFTRLVSASGTRLIRKELKVNGLSGNEYWLPFNFIANRFPFDVVTSLAGYDGELYVGTAAGLQVYPANSLTYLEHMENCYQLGAGPGKRLTPVSLVGIPAADKDKNVIRVMGAGFCIERTLDKKFRRCSAASGTVKRWRYGDDSGIWQFFNNAGRLEYSYKDETGKYSPPRSSLMNGRFPHDNLKDIAIYKNDVFTMWRNGWISRHANENMQMNNSTGIKNYNTRKAAALKFIRLERDQRFKGVTAPAGLYFEGDGDRLFHCVGNTGQPADWKEITQPDVVRGVLGQAKQPYIVNRDNLRMMAPRSRSSSGARFHFEFSTANGRWKRLKWNKDGLAIDQWSQLHYVNGQLWAATGEGMVRFSRQPGKPGESDKIILNPDNFTVIREPAVKGKVPPVTDIAVDGNRVTLRCESDGGLVFRGELDGQKDANVFKNLKETMGKDAVDPFVKQVQVPGGKDGFWEWVLDGRKGMKPGRLKARWQGEDVQLVGGRFGFDTVNSLAFYKKNTIEIATDSGGWVRSTHNDIAVPHLIRPAQSGLNAANVKEVRTSKTREGEPVLGLRLTGRTFVRMGKEGITGQTGEFPQLLANDGFWKYMTDDSGLTIVAAKSTGSSGRVTRKMEKGRFTDDRVSGLPASVEWKEGRFYLVPTKAGVLQLNRALKPVDIYPLPQPKPDMQGVLYVDMGAKGQVPFYLGADGFHAIDKDTMDSFTAAGRTVPGKPNIPSKAKVLGVEDGPQDFVRVRWQTENKRGWTLLNRTPQRLEEINSLYVNLSNFDKYISNRKKWGDTQPWMRIRLTDRQELEFLLYGSSQPYVLNLPEPTDVLAAVIDDKRLILIGKQKLWEINLEHPLSQ
jgi:hypothetical protein